MARVTGPALSVEALGPLGGALTFSTTQGGRVAKLTPRRANKPSGLDRAARARMSFCQRAWTADIIFNGIDVDWLDAARQKNLPPYNAFLSDALERANQGGAPRLSPIQIFGPIPADLATITHTLSGRALTLSCTVVNDNDGWGIWWKLLKNPLESTDLRRTVSSADLISSPAPGPTSRPILNLPHGSLWYPSATPFSYDGILGPPLTSIAPIHIP